MTNITLGLPPELLDALQHLAGRDEEAMRNIVCEALKRDIERRAWPQRSDKAAA